MSPTALFTRGDALRAPEHPLRFAVRPTHAANAPWRRLFAVCVTAALLASGTGLRAETYAVTTLAGDTGGRYLDGPAASARFGHVEDIVVDANGNAYVTDYSNFVIRKIDASGNVTTLAGLAHVSGYADGSGSAARFDVMFGLAFDTRGNLVVADTGNNVIRRVTPVGVVTTIAGTGVAGFQDGDVQSAKFESPKGVAVDGSNNIYVADADNHVIRRISSGGNVTTFAGQVGSPGSADGTGTAAQFNSPSRLCFDNSGNLLVSDHGNHTIRMITPAGVVTTLVGTPGRSGSTSGDLRTALLSSPEGITVDRSGNIFIADRGNNEIRMIRSGTIGRVAGIPSTYGLIDGPASSSATLFLPEGVCIDAKGTIWIADTKNCAIRTLLAPNTLKTIAGSSPAGGDDGLRGAARFVLPYGIALDAAGNAYVADCYNHTIRKITPAGLTTTFAGSAGVYGSADGAAADARFDFPTGIAVDAAGNVYVADENNATIRKITPAGVVSTLAGSAGVSGSADGTGAAARFYAPYSLAIDSAGNLYVGDIGNNTVRKVTPAGVVSTLAGSAGNSGTADGPAATARFSMPAGIAVDATGNVYVADRGDDVIRKIAPNGMVTTIAGLAGISGSADGIGGAARFNSPYGLAIDPNGNLYVCDSANDTIRKISPSGTVTTIAATVATNFSDGVGRSARFQVPMGLAIDRFGTLYVADEYNCAIRKIGLVAPPNPASVIGNLSVRANATAGQRLIVGFATIGGSKTMLMRGVGPGLAPYLGGATFAANPSLELYTSSLNLIDSNDDWGSASTLQNAFSSVGAFPLTPKSADAVLLRAVDGGYTLHMQTTASGLGLVEVYDTATSNTAARLINVSARYQVGTGADTLVAGFVISGPGPKTVLIRGVGPTLKQIFGVTDALDDTVVTVFDADQHLVATNDNWDPRLSTTFTQAGAFALVPGSRDSAILISLAPGSYTAQLSGAGNTTGNGLIEVYELGN